MLKCAVFTPFEGRCVVLSTHRASDLFATLSVRCTVSEMRIRMCFDDVAWERSEAIQDAWIHELFKEEILMAIGTFIRKHRRGVPVELCNPKAGAFNVSFRMKFEDGGSPIIRFPKPGATMFPEEKVRNEVAIIRYIHQHTTISCHLSCTGAPKRKVLSALVL